MRAARCLAVLVPSLTISPELRGRAEPPMRRSGRPRGARPCGSSRGRRGSPGMRLSDWAPDCASVGDSTVVLSNCAWSPGHDANHTPRIVGFEEPTSCFLVEGSLDETTAAGKGMEAAPVTEASRQPDPECASAELLRNRKKPDRVYKCISCSSQLASSLLLACTAEVMRVPVLAVLLRDQVRLLDLPGVGGLVFAQ